MPRPPSEFDTVSMELAFRLITDGISYDVYKICAVHGTVNVIDLLFLSQLIRLSKIDDITNSPSRHYYYLNYFFLII